LKLTFRRETERPSSRTIRTSDHKNQPYRISLYLPFRQLKNLKNRTLHYLLVSVIVTQPSYSAIMNTTLQEKLHHTCQESHKSSVRYINAGMYSDAIQSLILGLAALEVTLVHDDASIESLEDQDLCGCGDLILDRNPFDPSSMDKEPRSDLVHIALIYNLALAYHLYAMTENEEDPKYLCVVLKDALKLYQATEKRLCNLDSTSSFVIPALRDNMRHVVQSYIKMW
jgi:hypothetical protein